MSLETEPSTPTQRNAAPPASPFRLEGQSHPPRPAEDESKAQAASVAALGDVDTKVRDFISFNQSELTQTQNQAAEDIRSAEKKKKLICVISLILTIVSAVFLGLLVATSAVLPFLPLFLVSVITLVIVGGKCGDRFKEASLQAQQIYLRCSRALYLMDSSKYDEQPKAKAVALHNTLTDRYIMKATQPATRVIIQSEGPVSEEQQKMKEAWDGAFAASARDNGREFLKLIFNEYMTVEAKIKRDNDGDILWAAKARKDLIGVLDRGVGEKADVDPLDGVA